MEFWALVVYQVISTIYGAYLVETHYEEGVGPPKGIQIIILSVISPIPFTALVRDISKLLKRNHKKALRKIKSNINRDFYEDDFEFLRKNKFIK
ncbi:hypothetical protein [Flammeovirga agarivorans]|nr:hypothetical protein [Flammeovirga agarivorans]